VIRCGAGLIGYERNYELSLSFDQHCDLADGASEAEAIEEQIRSEFASACGYRPYLGLLTPHCVPGNAHSVFCDGRVQSFPLEDVRFDAVRGSGVQTTQEK
jgi:hypothetical protein